MSSDCSTDHRDLDRLVQQQRRREGVAVDPATGEPVVMAERPDVLADGDQQTAAARRLLAHLAVDLTDEATCRTVLQLADAGEHWAAIARGGRDGINDLHPLAGAIRLGTFVHIAAMAAANAVEARR